MGGVDVRGAAPGTRETDLLHPLATLEQVHAILLTGGSAFGLDAATGVMRWLEEHGHGVQVGPARVPIVPAAVLFDLWVGDARIRPDAASGYAACEAASTAHPAQGSVGAGAGASVGKLFGIGRAMKGGIGTASIKVGAITVGRAGGGERHRRRGRTPASGRVLAGARADDGRTPLDTLAAIIDGQLPAHLMAGMATTIGIVATDAQLTKAQTNKLAAMAHDGLSRSINPVHTATRWRRAVCRGHRRQRQARTPQRAGRTGGRGHRPRGAQWRARRHRTDRPAAAQRACELGLA